MVVSSSKDEEDEKEKKFYKQTKKCASIQEEKIKRAINIQTVSTACITARLKSYIKQCNAGCLLLLFTFIIIIVVIVFYEVYIMMRCMKGAEKRLN